ncbi:transcriptional regulator [Clostridia bacterium]|nr:transcriptional regulator [Clostridia bacterium]
MDAADRRSEILHILRGRQSPVSAGSLALQMQVSRQVIVGDIALLRAQGNDVIATVRGYTMALPAQPGRYIGKIACQHTLEDTGRELLSIVELGGEVLDVAVDHYLYGEITGQLNIATPRDVEAFIRKLGQNQARLLSELTGGVHLHAVACRDGAAFKAITARLEELGFLYSAV